MESLRENKLFDIRLIGAARSGAGSLFSTHEKTALLEGFCNSCQGNLVGVLARLCPLLPAGRGGWILQTSTLVRGTSNGVEGGTPV
jgi:hypothetical protein